MTNLEVNVREHRREEWRWKWKR